MEKGNIFHDYAEFYVNHPEFVERRSEDEFLQIMIENIGPFADDIDLRQLETEFQVGARKIREFIDSNVIEHKEVDGYEGTQGDNIFGDAFNLNVNSPVTEAWFHDSALSVRGMVDLLVSDTHLVDYKSSRRKKTAEKIVKGSRPATYEEARYPNFQALMYLTHHRKHVPDQKLEFTFLYFLDGLGDALNGDTQDPEVTVTYYPESFDQKTASMDMFEKMIRNVAKSNDRRKTLEKLGYTAYSDFMAENDFPEIYDKSVVETEFGQEFIAYAKKEVGDYKYVEKGCKSTLKKLIDFRNRNYFREDLDRFEEFMEQKIEELNNYMENGFPLGDRDPEELPERDMILRREEVEQ
jgi:hypothetical protein